MIYLWLQHFGLAGCSYQHATIAHLLESSFLYPVPLSEARYREWGGGELVNPPTLAGVISSVFDRAWSR